MREQIGEFHICTFDALTTWELYEIMRARADVFVGEEKILYPDADGIDYDSVHVFSADPDGRVTAYLRMFPKADEPGVVQMVIGPVDLLRERFDAPSAAHELQWSSVLRGPKRSVDQRTAARELDMISQE